MKKFVNRSDKARVEWTVNRLVNYHKDGTVTLDNAVQRGFVWDNARKSKLIESLILEDPIPPIYAAKFGETYSLIDGKQRTGAVSEFLDDGFALEGLEMFSLEDVETGEMEDYDINGMKFSDLPEIFQNAIKDSALTVITLHEPTEEKICEVFFKLNNGKPLNAITLTRVKAKSRKEIVELGSHELFKNALTAKALERYTNEDIVVKSWAVLHQEEPSLETKAIRPLMETMEFTDDDKSQLEECFDRILEVHGLIEDKKIAKRILTRTHMISIMRVVWKSIEDGLSAKQFMEWFVTFYAGKKKATISTVYNSYAGAGSARKESVQKRLGEVMKHYTAYFSGKLANYAA